MSYGPFSTRELNPHVVYARDKDGSKIVEKTTFVNASDKYQGGKLELPDRWKYKLWSSKREPTNAGDGYFSWNGKPDAPAFEYPGGTKAAPLVYSDKTSYLKARRPEKVAFESRDAERTGEFCDTIRTEQYRYALQMEKKHMNSKARNEAMQRLLEKMEREKKPRQFVSGLNEPDALYDIGRSQETEFDPKSHRDHYYSQTLEKNMHRPRRMGLMRQSSAVIGDAGDHTPSKPQFGRLNVTKHFNDRYHLKVPGM